MDPIAHTLVGAALAQTGLARKTACGTAAFIIGANLPDIDGVSMLVGLDPSLLLRRGWTHGILALAVLPVLLTGALVLWHRSRKLSSSDIPIRAGMLLGLSYFAVATHSTLDWLNIYGVRWLMPLSGEWYYGDTLFIADPWIWLVLGSAVFLFRSQRFVSITGWTLLGAFWLALLMGRSGLWSAKILWLTGLITIILMRLRRVGHREEAAARLAVASTALVFSYIIAMYIVAQYARAMTARELADQGFHWEELMVAPLPVTPWVRDVVAQTPSGYRYGKARLLPRFELEVSSRTLPLLGVSGVVQEATASPTVRGFMNWARFPFAEINETPSGWTVYLLDARYRRSKSVGFGAARVEIAKEQIE